eukprot:CAMPEP_0175133396 /NCGR_PEP_ID=MMETSP0087-20121206/7618_1 /TAXON_ID=136419 /ORGANISM="Unknown Unknown, Strain D1" /LENGTH=297 /DNA_ID=CAMNT_0016415879 /DNA_START=715 /DNA_END=1608 /DNA_ORIENTATION=+
MQTLSVRLRRTDSIVCSLVGLILLPKVSIIALDVSLLKRSILMKVSEIQIIPMPSGRKRIRAHANPLSDHDFPEVPLVPAGMDWSKHYPKVQAGQQVTIADIGCGFGGLSVTLAEMFPDKLVLGLEIRGMVVNAVEERIQKLRDDAEADNSEKKETTNYQNVSVLRINIMKHAPCVFNQGQLEKMFFLFPDPHFKRSNFRRRVINPNFLAVYAYILKVGGILYTITDVEDLHKWMAKHLDEHPLFERLTEEEMAADPCVEAIKCSSEEGKKVSRHQGNKYPAIYRRIDPFKKHKGSA